MSDLAMETWNGLPVLKIKNNAAEAMIASSSSSSSSSKKNTSSSSSTKKSTVTTTTTTTVTVKVKCINGCCPAICCCNSSCKTNCTVKCDTNKTTNNNNNSSNNTTNTTPKKVRYYEYMKWSEWKDGYSYHSKAENKKVDSKWQYRIPEYEWSKETSLAGYTKTGNYEDRDA